MIKWDKLSWIASGIFVTGIILGATINNSFLFLLVIAYLLRPSLLALGGSKEKFADERQIKIQYHSGNIAFTVLILVIIIFSLIEQMAGRPYDKYNDIIIIGLLTRALVGLVMIGDYKAAAARIGFFMALLLALFIILESSSGGFNPIVFLLVSPAVIIAIVSYIGLKRPMLSSIFFAGLGIVSIILLSLRHNLSVAVSVSTNAAICLPLLVEAFLFYKGARAEKSSDE